MECAHLEGPRRNATWSLFSFYATIILFCLENLSSVEYASNIVNPVVKFRLAFSYLEKVLSLDR
jgi:hypothetical protein